ncbi:hypothetical protein F1880_005580 [Penicillium rolfsii]|nr:hypothetical protein F1880_005580 [Penicillium rolfsii]
MDATERDKSLLSSAPAGYRVHPQRFLWRLHSLIGQVLFVIGICAASLPLVYYVYCYHVQEIEKATCRGRTSDLIIILGGPFLLLYLVKSVLQYFALRYTR